MARLSLGFSEAFDRILSDLAAKEGIGKAQVVRRAVGLLALAVAERAQGRGLVVSPADREGKQVSGSTVGQAVDLAAAEARIPDPGVVELPRVGRELARWVILLLGACIALVALHGAMSLPSLAEVQAAVGPERAFEAYRELRAAWFQEVRGLLELLLPLFVTLLGTIIGYLFGRQH